MSKPERITITTSFEELSDLQSRAARMTQAEKARCNVPEFVRNAIAFYSAEQDRCLSCSANTPCQVHGTKVLRPAVAAESDVSTEDVRRVTAAYFSHFRTARGVAPQFDGAEGRAVKSLIRRMGADQTINIIERAYADTFWRNTATILSIDADPSRHLGTPSKSAMRSSLQRDSGYQGGKEKR